LRKIKIPVLSVLIIALMSGLVFFAAMQIGVAVTVYIPAGVAKTAGAVILIGLGFWAVIQMRRSGESGESETDAAASGEKQEDEQENGQVARVLSIELKRLGLVIQILRTPSAADMDRSGNISAMEAAWLGLALSLDAFGAGIGAAFIGYTPLLTSAVIAVASGSFILGGLRFGFMYSNVQWIRKLSVLPGCILMLMGLFRLM
jgi:putative sporulation protein YtaF